MVRSNHGDHVTTGCKKGFTEWIYFNRKGKIVTEDDLPQRESRGVTGVKVAEFNNDKSEGASCWYKLKR